MDWLDKKVKYCGTRTIEVCRFDTGVCSIDGLVLRWVDSTRMVQTPRDAIKYFMKKEFNAVFDVELISRSGKDYKKIQRYVEAGYIVYGVRLMEYFVDYRPPWYRVYAFKVR